MAKSMALRSAMKYNPDGKVGNMANFARKENKFVPKKLMTKGNMMAMAKKAC